MTHQLALSPIMQPSVTIDDLPFSERPVQRIRDVGASSCNTGELLAALIGGKNALSTAQRLLAKCETISDLRGLSDDEMTAISGIGPATAARLKAAIELGHRLANFVPIERPAIGSPADAAQLLMPEMSALDQEHLRVILLDTRNRVLSVAEVYRGSVNTTMLRVGELFTEAVRRNAASIIVVHNHPSGEVSPSPDDVAVTRLIVEAGKLLDIEVLDHLLIGQGRFVSLKERGLGFS